MIVCFPGTKSISHIQHNKASSCLCSAAYLIDASAGVVRHLTKTCRSPLTFKSCLLQNKHLSDGNRMALVLGCSFDRFLLLELLTSFSREKVSEICIFKGETFVKFL